MACAEIVDGGLETHVAVGVQDAEDMSGIQLFIFGELEDDPVQFRAMQTASGGRRTVPQIFINGTHVGGSDDLVALDADGGLDLLLREKMLV